MRRAMRSSCIRSSGSCITRTNERRLRDALGHGLMEHLSWDRASAQYVAFIDDLLRQPGRIEVGDLLTSA